MITVPFRRPALWAEQLHQRHEGNRPIAIGNGNAGGEARKLAAADPQRRANGIERNRDALFVTGGEKRFKCRQRRRHDEFERRPTARLGWDGDLATKPVDGFAHDVQPDPAAGNIGYRPGRADTAAEQQPHEFLRTSLRSVRPEQAALPGDAADRREIDAAAIVPALEHDLLAPARDGKADPPGRPLARPP